MDYRFGYAGVDREHEVAIGFAREAGDIPLDPSHACRRYPGADPGASPDYSDRVPVAALGERWSATMRGSGDNFAIGTPGSCTPSRLRIR